MKSSRQLQAATMLIAALISAAVLSIAVSPALTATSPVLASELPTVTIIGKRMSRAEKAAFAQPENTRNDKQTTLAKTEATTLTAPSVD
ncbi:hypothetical protein [Paraherbaspirillum soli]|uniref:Uncharacterized protein n=1 Tax=Paraherbaspirillum soli TaxID=631222 RepID=A0ABW0MAY5_9BURK